jgi:TonB family protein
MKTTFVFIGFLLLATAVAQQHDEPASGAKPDQVTPTGVKEQDQGKDVKSGCEGLGQVEVLSNVGGADICPYLKQVLNNVRASWFALMPDEARPPVSKKGKVVVRFAILKDGSVSGLVLTTSSGDENLDHAVRGGVTNASPFPPLPQAVKGQYVGLRFSFSYNDPPEDWQPAKKRECTAEDYLKSSASTGGNSLEIWPPGPVKLSVAKHLRFRVKDDNAYVWIANWAVTGGLCKTADCGSVSELGLYAAPAMLPPSPDVVLTVAEKWEPCRSGSVRLTLVPADPPQ